MGAVKTLLTGNGVFIINFMGSLDSAMFASLYATFLAVFPEVKVFLINEPDDTKTLQNILLAASKSGILPSGLPEYRGAIPQAAVFTDGFAPVELKTMEMTRIDTK
jgi:hypothetical protein